MSAGSVWVVMDEADHEGGSLVGVFSTIGQAVEGVEDYRGIGCSGGVIMAYAMTLDAPPPRARYIAGLIRAYGSRS